VLGDAYLFAQMSRRELRHAGERGNLDDVRAGALPIHADPPMRIATLREGTMVQHVLLTSSARTINERSFVNLIMSNWLEHSREQI
jgi:hypothetical protein